MSNLPDIQENNEQILNDIQSLQQMEQQLFNNLETNPNLTSTQQQDIIQKINQISQMRINLYQTLTGINGFYQNALSSSIGTLQEQTSAIAIVENELNNAKKRLDMLEVEKNNKMRLVEINDYYGDKYAEHSQLMKIIIFTLIPVIILAVLNSKGLLPNIIYYLLLTIVSFIGAIYFWYRFSSIIRRDDMNYEHYDWYFNPSTAPPGSSDSTDPWGNGTYGTCIGELCCSDGQTYDSSLNLCVDTSSSGTTTETFVTESMVNDILTQNSDKPKTIVSINGGSSVQPSVSESFIYK